jgi:hypothetical protein
MPFRVTTPLDPLAQQAAATLTVRPRIEWRHWLQWPVRIARQLRDMLTEPRRLAREREIASQEGRWLRLSTMSDGEVVGLDRSAEP